MLEFTGEDELDYVLEGRPWYVRGLIFHLERWMEDFRESNPITFLGVWVKTLNNNAVQEGRNHE